MQKRCLIVVCTCFFVVCLFLCWFVCFFVCWLVCLFIYFLWWEKTLKMFLGFRYGQMVKRTFLNLPRTGILLGLAPVLGRSVDEIGSDWVECM